MPRESEMIRIVGEKYYTSIYYIFIFVFHLRNIEFIVDGSLGIELFGSAQPHKLKKDLPFKFPLPFSH